MLCLPFFPSGKTFVLASGVGVCNKGHVRLRDFASIHAFLSDQGIDELQTAIDERREVRLRRLWEAEVEALEPGLLVPEVEVFLETS